MTTIQTAMRLHSHVENVLKRAAEENMPISIRDLYQNPDIQAAAKNQDQVRGVVKAYANNKIALELPLEDASGDRRARLGYMWNTELSGHAAEEAKAMIQKMRSRTKRLVEEAKPEPQKPVQEEKPPVQMELAVEAPKPQHEIELVLGAVSVTIGKNDATGAIRISIKVD